MYKWIFFFAISAIVLFLLFLPDLMPRCCCCNKLKPRPFIRIHRVVGINPGYGGSRSVCTKCCREYSIENLKDLDQLFTIRRKIRLDSLSKDL